MKNKIIRITTVPVSLNILLKGQLSFLNGHFKVLAVSGSNTDLDIVRQREKVDVFPIEMQRNISPIKDIISLWKLYNYFRKEKPIIVHSITPKAGLLSMSAAYFANVPIRIHTFTGLIFPTKKGILQKILILMDRILCCFATNIYPEGNGVRKDLVKYKITTKPLMVLANGNVNGIDTTFFSPIQVAVTDKKNLRKQLGIKDSDFVFVGRLVGDKGINELVAAFGQLEMDNVKLLLVGNEEIDLDPLQVNTCNEIAINNNIITVGFQSDVRSYFAISDTLVFPSYREGFPNVVLQAGAMGLPCIVTDISGSNEIILEGQNGIIIPVKDEVAISNAMIKVSSDKDYYSVLKRNARKMITSRYEQKMVWEALLAEYKSLEKNV
ncbi:glycosyltransferase family 4 protein [Flavobacterium sp. XN-5]|uniref:glycosyltransferase family 4 protein n=1 Tax=Flavobacterium sp. XN-5 TaxID=2599390 RepID=UPI0011CCD531|nr:glycosyltransferase family 4 protein [Flavobacterium sp. XN-5]NGY37424.1 glycosyltransferase family 4 protein [Flavobacterium sp. XN-5]